MGKQCYHGSVFVTVHVNMSSDNLVSASSQLHGADAHLHGEHRSPVHQVCVLLQTARGLNPACYTGHSGAAGPRVREREGCE